MGAAVMEGQLSIFDVMGDGAAASSAPVGPVRDADGWRHAGFHVIGDVLVPIRERGGDYEIAPTTLRRHRRHFVWPADMPHWPRRALGPMGTAIRPLPDARARLNGAMAEAYDHSSGRADPTTKHMACCLTCHAVDTATRVVVSHNRCERKSHP